MSAFIVDDAILNQIRNKLIANDVLGNRFRSVPATYEFITKEMTNLVNKWAKMNRYAIKCRYGDVVKPSRFASLPVSQNLKDIISDVQFFKHLQCLQYQCSEGDTEKRHRKSWKLLEDQMSNIAQRIVSNLSDYADVQWG